MCLRAEMCQIMLKDIFLFVIYFVNLGLTYHLRPHLESGNIVKDRLQPKTVMEALGKEIRLLVHRDVRNLLTNLIQNT